VKTSTLELQAADGHSLSAYCAQPSDTPRAALVIVQEVFGVNGHIRNLCERWAAEGYLAIAPALYDRVARGVELAYGPDGVARGRDIRTQVSDEIALRDVEAAVDHAARALGDGIKVGVVGFCWGGTLAWLAATRLQKVAAAVAYYGTGIAGYVNEGPLMPVMLHFGAQDANIPPADVARIRAAHPELPAFIYEAGHGFSCDDRAAYDAPSAASALERTRAFLAQHLDTGSAGR